MASSDAFNPYGQLSNPDRHNDLPMMTGLVLVHGVGCLMCASVRGLEMEFFVEKFVAKFQWDFKKSHEITKIYGSAIEFLTVFWSCFDNVLTGVSKCPLFWGFCFHHLPIFVGDEISPRVGWCETLGHLPTSVWHLDVQRLGFHCRKWALNNGWTSLGEQAPNKAMSHESLIGENFFGQFKQQ